MPASSNFGTSRPGARVSLVAAAGPGNGVGRGAAGNANMPFTRTMLEFFDAELAGALFSAAVPVFPSFAPLLFCCATSGKAKNALIAITRHDLRITFLPQRNSPNPAPIPSVIDVPAATRPLVIGGRARQCAVLELVARKLRRHLNQHLFLGPEKPQKETEHGAVRLFHNSL